VWGCGGAEMALVKHFRELRVYQLAFEAAMEIFGLSKRWPADERFSLTDQMRRSSRSACGCVAEAWRKRRYPSHFVSKLTDADGEVAETQNWLLFASACGYMTTEQHDRLWAKYELVTKGLVRMMADPEDWCGPSLLRDGTAEYLVEDELLSR